MGLWIEVVWREEGDSCLGGDTEGCRSGDLLRGRGDREEKCGEGGEWGRLTDCNGDHETLGGEAGGGEGGVLAGDLLVVCPTMESMEKPSLLLISLLNSLLNRFGWFKAWWAPWKRDMVAPVIPCGTPPPTKESKVLFRNPGGSTLSPKSLPDPHWRERERFNPKVVLEQQQRGEAQCSRCDGKNATNVC